LSTLRFRHLDHAVSLIAAGFDHLPPVRAVDQEVGAKFGSIPESGIDRADDREFLGVDAKLHPARGQLKFEPTNIACGLDRTLLESVPRGRQEKPANRIPDSTGSRGELVRPGSRLEDDFVAADLQRRSSMEPQVVPTETRVEARIGKERDPGCDVPERGLVLLLERLLPPQPNTLSLSLPQSGGFLTTL
jgi:hypothetical protein